MKARVAFPFDNRMLNLEEYWLNSWHMVSMLYPVAKMVEFVSILGELNSPRWLWEFVEVHVEQ